MTWSTEPAHQATDSIINAAAAAAAAVATADDNDDTGRRNVSVGVTVHILEMYVFRFHYRQHHSSFFHHVI